MISTAHLCRILCLALLCFITVNQAEAAISFGMNKILKVRVGKDVERSYADATAENWLYAPRQVYDAASRETVITLPYGNNEKLYFEPPSGVLSDVAPDGYALFYSQGDGKTKSHLTYALAFDTYIASFRLQVGYAELAMAPSCVAGAEYSLDGKTWKRIHEHAAGTKKTVNQFVPNITIDGIKTRKLLIRLYTRDTDNPDAARSANQYIKIRMTGSPAWGDAKTTFFKCANTLAVTEYQR